jgi:flagellar protein FlbD
VRKGSGMIALTRLDGTPIVVNVDLVQWVEETPDTVVALTNGERLLVREPAGELVRRAVEFKRAVATGPSVRRQAGDGQDSFEY